MISYRPFRNTDPPVVTAIWRTQAGQPGYAQPVSVDVFEQMVFAKLYFDYEGLIIARDGERPIGFAHAGFGPNATRDGISTEVGITSIVRVTPDCPHPDQVAGELIDRCEVYLREAGARELCGGGIRPLSPFYLGLYGGSEPPGILHTDRAACEAFTSRGYAEAEQSVTLKLQLDAFDAPFDRRQMQIRRQMLVEVQNDAVPADWWEACLLGEFDLTRFEVVPRGQDRPVAHAVFRGMEPIGAGMLGRRIGLVDLWVDEALRRRGVAVYLLSEAFRQFMRQGVTLIEAQTRNDNGPARALLEKLGFQPVAHGTVFRKQ